MILSRGIKIMAAYAGVIPLQGPCRDNDSHQFPLIHTGQGARQPAAAKHTQSPLSRCHYCGGSGCVCVCVVRVEVVWHECDGGEG